MQKFIENIVYVQVKRAVTLGIGFLVGAGVFSATEGDAQTAAVTAVVAQLALSVVYWAYDKWVKPHVLKLLGLAVADAVTKR